MHCTYAMVEKHQYPLLRRIIRGMPNEFDEWCQKQEEKSVYERASGDHTISFVMIDPAKFEAWCKENGHSPSEILLTNYAAGL
jgi:hypothetical protein